MPAKRKAKPMRGRPPKAGARMGSPILVRVSPEEREALQAAADAAGKPLSAWIRERALGGAMDDKSIRALRADEDSDDVVRAVCDYALTGEPIDLAPRHSVDVAELRDMSREQARRWCADAYRSRIEDR